MSSAQAGFLYRFVGVKSTKITYFHQIAFNVWSGNAINSSDEKLWYGELIKRDVYSVEKSLIDERVFGP